MATHEVKIKRHTIVAEDTMCFVFEKPAGFEFKAGQSVDLSLIDPPETDAEGNTRAFSLVSAPYETELAVATRMRDTAFKRVLKTLVPGSRLRLAGPFGSFTLHQNAARSAVFIAGGIGITPFFSMIKQASHEQLAHRLFLFYSNKYPEGCAFLEELKLLEQLNSNFQLIATMTQMQQSRRPWQGPTKRIGPSILQQVLKHLKGPLYYLAGPPRMVAGLRLILQAAGIDGDDIRSEEFVGYE